MLQGGQVRIVRMKAIDKLLLGICVITMMLNGCQSARRSFRYGDGSTYNVSANYNPTQKFFVRSVEFVNGNGASIPASELSKKLPKLFDSEYHDGDIPIKIVIRYGEWRKLPQDIYSLFSLLSLTIIPWESGFEAYADVDILTDDGEAVVPPARYMEVCYEKTSYLLFFGGWGYEAKAGFQFNVMDATLAIIRSSKSCTDFFINCVACCIAQQLEKHALDRITAPNMSFE